MTKYFFIIAIVFLLTNCGFKVVDYSKLNNFKIYDIVTAGENRINYKVKNNIKVISNNNSSREIIINLFSVSKKSIKEKNNSNEITKYKLEINTKVDYKILNNNKTGNFEMLVSGDYLVAQKYSETLKNQARLIDNLTLEISSQIKRKLSNQLNDL